MPLHSSNKPQLTGMIILFIGVALLAFTFINAYFFLQEPLGLIAAGDLARVFGDALAPLIQACIRLMYLGIMGWIGSLLTIRGIPLMTHKQIPVATQAAQTEPKPQPVKRPQPTPSPTPHPSTPQESQSATHQLTTQHTSTPRKEEPKAILIPPENQREE